ncbi:hypothetical protein NQ315_001627 [Exocentrus adspersus]|uniref:Uncharacterized protein n=1 Tax=Exocentrus adspersus TaxID=1586481 RepID=A0AAV8WAI6_9CUCU|nr:hypothetical protein NQ315_001627 [Exocentrus adspersus]
MRFVLFDKGQNKEWTIFVSLFKEKLSSMRSAREKTCGDLWRQIAGVVRLCVHQTDSRRMHLAELRRLDAESAIEIADNEERIRKKEDLLNDLEKDYDNKLHERQVTVKHLENELEDLNKAFLKVKKNLQRDLQTDEKLLFFLTDLATQSLRYLEGVLKKGEHTRNLANTCKKFETEREKIFKYIPLAHRLRKYEGDVVDYQESLKIISEQMKAVGTVEDNVHLPLLKLPRKKSSGRPKTAASDTVSKSAVTSTSDSKRITTVKEVKIQFKASSRDAESSSSTYSTPRSRETSTKNIFERCFDSLQNLENFWLTFNQVEIDYMEIKEEKSVLEEENKKLRGMIRAVLEAAALSQPESNSRVSTRLPSKRRSAYSAPLRRVLFA